MMRTYVELDPARVPLELRQRALLAVEAAARWLELPSTPGVVWTAPARLVPIAWGGDEHDKPVTWGAWCLAARPDRIFLRVDRPADVVEATLHECRHLWQLQHGHWAEVAGSGPPSNYPRLERDANEWAVLAARRPL